MRRALTGVEGIADLKTDLGEQSCSFQAPANMDVEAMLNKIADDGNEHIAGWSKADDDAKPADNDGAATSKKSGTQAVSLKLPGMT